MCLLAWYRSLRGKRAASSRSKRTWSKASASSRQPSSSSSSTVLAASLEMGVSECAVHHHTAGGGHHHHHHHHSHNQQQQQAKMMQQQQQQQHHHHCCAHHPSATSASAAVPLVVQNGHHHHHHHHHHGQQQQQIQQQQQQQHRHQHHHLHNHNQRNQHRQELQLEQDQQQHVIVVPRSNHLQQQAHHHHEAQHAGDAKILAPLKRMKVLKKLRRKIGLASRSSNTGTNNLPPLTFHEVCGDNIRLGNGGTVARRTESFCKGVTFSSRPVLIGEKVCIKFLEISNNWSGVIRFGFTSNDPMSQDGSLPRYACPDLTNKPGYWAKALAERFAERDTILFYYVTSTGDVHFGVNGEEKGVFFGGVETRSPLWAIIDVYGNSTAIELVDPNRMHFNNVRRGIEHSNEDNAQHSRRSAMDDASNAGRDLERIIVPAMQAVSIHHEHDVELPGLRFQPTGVLFTPLPFHPTRGRNIHFSNNQCVATRSDTEFCHGYVFTNRPLILGERLVVQILATEPMYVGALALGLTSCDPGLLSVSELPDDSDQLIDRPEYWVVSKDVASNPQPGDEIAFTVTHFGEVQMSKNGGPATVVMHVDQSLQLWAFVDVYGSTQRVRMLVSRSSAPGSPPRQQRPQPLQPQPQPQIVQSPIPQQQQQQQQPHCAPVPVTAVAADISRFPDMVQLKPSVGGGTVLVVNLPPQPAYAGPAQQPPPPQPIYGQTGRGPAARQGGSPQQPTGTMASTGSSTYVDPVTYQSLDGVAASSSSSAAGGASSSLQQWSEGLQPTPGQPSECSICYERSIDSVLYMCGHMCMCYTCAIQQWRGKGGGHCPLCRATIRDVIRIYRS